MLAQQFGELFAQVGLVVVARRFLGVVERLFRPAGHRTIDGNVINTGTV
jgi:hypothetical protein